MLSVKQMHEMEKKLKQRFFELREEIRHELILTEQQPFIELSGKVHDIEEESVADLLVDLQLASIDRHVEEIRDIDAALIRIAERSYGVCCDCGSDIDLQRLLSNPTARRCHVCQTKYEKTHAAHIYASL